MPKKIFTQELEGARQTGRPRKGWREEVERDLQVLGVRRWRVGDRQGQMERYCWTGQSPQRAVAPTEEEEYTVIIIAVKTFSSLCWQFRIQYTRLCEPSSGREPGLDNPCRQCSVDDRKINKNTEYRWNNFDGTERKQCGRKSLPQCDFVHFNPQATNVIYIWSTHS